MGVKLEDAQGTNGGNSENKGFGRYSAEKTLRIIGTIILWVGCITSFLMFIAASSVDKDPFFLLDKIAVYMAATITLLISLAIWATLRVLSNISMNLYKLNEKR